jgi:hypothetical protein
MGRLVDRGRIVVAVSFVVLALAAIVLILGSPQRRVETATRSPLQWPDKIPLAFEVNAGQGDTDANFIARGRGYSVLLFPTGARLLTGRSAVRLKFAGADPTATLQPEQPLSTRVNYFLGSDPGKWRTGIPTFSRVVNPKPFPGARLAFYGTQRALRYEFELEPGARPEAIWLEFEGADRVEIDAHGALAIETAEGSFHQSRPLAYQLADGGKTPIPAEYLSATGRIWFRLGEHRATDPLVIELAIEYNSDIKRDDCARCAGIALDSAGDAYVVGNTVSGTFLPLDGEAEQHDAFVAKVDRADSLPIFVTYFGGQGDDLAYGIGVDSHGRATIAGCTASVDLPLTNPLQRKNGGGGDAFVATLNADGSGLIFSTYFGGTGEDCARGIAVDEQAAIHVAGGTRSTDFPVVNSIQGRYQGGESDAFVLKLAAPRPEVVYSTYLGGRYGDWAYAVASDAQGNSYVSGSTQSLNFPTFRPIQPAMGGGLCGSVPCHDVFVAKLDGRGATMHYSSFLGGNNNEYGTAITVDRDGNAYVAGSTASQNFPTTQALGPAHAIGKNDAYVAKVNSAGSALVYSTQFGGSGQDYVAGIAVNRRGEAFVTGLTDSRERPPTRRLYTPIATGRCGFSQCADAFVAKLNAEGTAITDWTHLGDADGDGGIAVTVSNTGEVLAVGNSRSLTYPLENVLQIAHGSNRYDFWLAKIGHPPTR